MRLLLLLAVMLIFTPATARADDPPGLATGLSADKALAADAIDARILACRTADAMLTVTDAAGKPLADADVVVRMVRHKFLFGANAFMADHCRTPAEQETYRKEFADLLNYATLPFYWGMYEREEGKLWDVKLTYMARWCASQGIRVKGHPLCWHNVYPKWLAGRSDDEVWRLQLARVKREAAAFAGRIDTWDAVNEAVIMPNFRAPNGISNECRKVGRVELLKQVFDTARKANPKATLLLNDYDTSAAYEKLIEQSLKAGVPIDVIGIQSHMHTGYWGASKAWEVTERFARFGKPIQYSELTILSGHLKTDRDWESIQPDWNTTPEGEKLQAEQAAELYRVLFSHPAVTAITWWDFSDQGAWQGAPSGLVRKDMTPKPAYTALHKLIREQWWTGPLKLRTDKEGRVSFRGYLGDYEVWAGQGKGQFRLELPGKAAVAATVQSREASPGN
ncbi:MAG: Anti-sigma-I factor RsgI6 [Phycisphaerae bacterium]|nr:Anti-sigma-I factor RsgI6 [Phycisphaerae bacterium]